jgi:hypothetical protein
VAFSFLTTFSVWRDIVTIYKARLGIIAVLFLCVSAVAQAQDQRAHRQLTSPDQNGLTKSRLALFARLQGLIDQAKAQAGSPDAKPLDAETFEALQQALRDFQKDTSPDPIPDPNAIPDPSNPGTRRLNPREANPNRPNDNQPRIDPLNPTDPNSADPKPVNPRPADPNIENPAQPRNPRTTQPPNNTGPNPPRTKPRQNTEPRPLSESDRKLLQSLFPDLGNRNSTNPAKPPSNDPQNVDPGNRRPNETEPRNTDPKNPGEAPFVPNDEPIITNEDPSFRERKPQSRPSNSVPPNDPTHEAPNSLDPRQPIRNGENDPRTPLQNPKTLQEQLRVLNDAMKRIGEEQRLAGNDALQDLSSFQPPNRQNNNRRPNPAEQQNSDPNVIKTDPWVNPNDETIKKLIENARRNGTETPNQNNNAQASNNNRNNAQSNDPTDLSNMNIDDRMLTILERARRRVRADAQKEKNNAQARNSETGNSPDDGGPDDGNDDGWEKTLNGFLQDAAKRATRETPPADRPNPPPRRRRPEPRQARQDSDDSDSWLARTGDAANNMFMDMTNGESQTRTSGSGPTFGSSSGTFPVLPVLLILGIAGIVYWMMKRTEQSRQLATAGAAETTPMPTDVSSREDVVQAFHAITSRTPEVSSDSWTHRKAAEAMIEAKPSNEFDVETLANVYEEARYQPEDAQFTDDQITKARRAVERWNS